MRSVAVLGHSVVRNHELSVIQKFLVCGSCCARDGRVPASAILFSCVSCVSWLNISIRMSDFETRFGGIARLYGKSGLDKLRAAHVCVVGIGGVGTWAAEALARSGVGALTLVDLDEVCVTNINRQLHALTETVGRAKVEVMGERIRAINPDCRVTAEPKFFNEQTAEEFLAPKYDFVLDAIDTVTNKVLLLAGCREKNLPVVSCGGAGGRRD